MLQATTSQYKTKMADNTIVCSVIIATLLIKKKKKLHARRNRTIWTRHWILNRPKYGAYHQLINELRLSDQNSYKNFLRMDVLSFETLLSMVTPMIKKKDTLMRDSISPAERLAVTIRFLATGQYSHY